MVPTREQCIQMLNDYSTPPRVIRHCILVADISVKMAELLKNRGFCIDVRAVEAAALLHDIARTKKNHATAGAEILNSKGYYEIAEIVRQHMKLDVDQKDRISEITIVYLADKFADGEKIVTLGQRFSKKEELFNNDSEALNSLRENFETAHKLQESVAEAIGWRGELTELLR